MGSININKINNKGCSILTTANNHLKLNIMKFYFRNANPLQELNAYKKGTKMSLTQYQKALSFINEGYSFQLVVDSRKEPIKVVKVLKGNKL